MIDLGFSEKERAIFNHTDSKVAFNVSLIGKQLAFDLRFRKQIVLMLEVGRIYELGLGLRSDIILKRN